MIKVGVLYEFMKVYHRKKWLVIETWGFIKDIHIRELTETDIKVRYEGARVLLLIKTEYTKQELSFKVCDNGKEYNIVIEAYPDPERSIIYVVGE